MKSGILRRNLLPTVVSALLPLVSVTTTAGSSLFVSAQFGNGVLRFSSRGTSQLFASVQSPQGMALDAAGNLYVASFEDSAVYLISRDGEKQIFISGGLIGNPTSLAFDSSGNLFVGKTVNPAGIIKVTPDGTASLFASKVEPNGLAVDASDILFATDLLKDGDLHGTTPTVRASRLRLASVSRKKWPSTLRVICLSQTLLLGRL